MEESKILLSKEWIDPHTGHTCIGIHDESGPMPKTLPKKSKNAKLGSKVKIETYHIPPPPTDEDIAAFYQYL